MMEDSRQEGMQKGMQKGEALGTLHTLAELVRDGLLNVKEAARRAKLSETAFEAELKKLE